MPNSDKLLEIRSIAKSFGGVKAVQSVSFDIDVNEVVAIVGDNGAGKSTLIKILAGAHQQDSGELLLNGQPVQLSKPDDARQLGIETVFQDLALINDFDAAGNIFLGDELYRKLFGFLPVLDRKTMREISSKLLDKVKVTLPDNSMAVNQMSGGQRQAIAIARLLRSEHAKLIIMDEPTAALGVREQGKVLELIETLAQQGVSILLISHNLEHVFRVSQKIVILQGGRCVAVVKTAEVNKGQVVQMIMGSA